jgi:hypothetical protein
VHDVSSREAVSRKFNIHEADLVDIADMLEMGPYSLAVLTFFARDCLKGAAIYRRHVYKTFLLL